MTSLTVDVGTAAWRSWRLYLYLGPVLAWSGTTCLILATTSDGPWALRVALFVLGMAAAFMCGVWIHRGRVMGRLAREQAELIATIFAPAAAGARVVITRDEPLAVEWPSSN